MNDSKTILCCTQNDTILLLRHLQHCGIAGRAVRPPRDKVIRSCSWGVRISAKDTERAEACLHSLPSLRWQWME